MATRQSGVGDVRAAVLAALISLAGLSPASAQWSVGVGIEFGDPSYYYGPPPVYYGPPPIYLYEQPPTYYAPAPPIVYAPAQIPSAVPADVVFDKLDRAGYRELGPMAFRDGVYKLSAVNRHGDFVALEVSALTGSVESETVIGAGQAAIPPVEPSTSAEPAPPARDEGRDPLVVY
jgi:hypothetical protein